MFLKRFLFGSAACLSLLSSLSADTITLKNGDKVEGKVLSETDTQLVVEERISASIVDSRTILKSDIASVAKTAEDEAAYEVVKSWQPGPNTLPPNSYDSILSTLQSFVNKYPQSSHLADVTQKLATYAEEKRRVDAGEIRLAGRWISTEEVRRERYQILAQIQFGQLQDLARRGDLVGALNTFDQLEKIYPGARVYPDAVELVRPLLPSLKSLCDRTLTQYKQRKAEREEGTKLLSVTDHERAAVALATEERQNDALMAAAQKANQKWGPLLPTSEKSIQAVMAKIPTEQQRLTALPVANMHKSIVSAETAQQLAQRKNYPDASKAFKEAISAWPANELATRGDKEVSALIAASTPAPVVAAATPTPSPTPAARPTPGPTVALATPAPSATLAANDEPGFVGSGLFYGLLALVILGGVYGGMAYLKKKKAKGEEEA